MKNKFFTVTRICNLLCVILMLALLVMQFLPYWLDKDNLEVSLAEYVWNPTDHKDMSKQFKANYQTFGVEYDINDLVTGPIILMATSVITAFLCTIHSGKSKYSWIPLVGAAVNAYGFATNMALQYNSIWVVHFALSLVVVVLALVAIIVPIIVKERAIRAADAAAMAAAQAE